jgi:hypothetical protein
VKSEVRDMQTLRGHTMMAFSVTVRKSAKYRIISNDTNLRTV